MLSKISRREYQLDYKKGAEVLPARLLEEIQKYVEGSLIYIPKKSNKVGWGYISGTRQMIDQRNKKINKLFAEGATVTELAEQFHLTEDSIKKIVYGKKQI
jgi:Mor family transcriptional regulator